MGVSSTMKDLIGIVLAGGQSKRFGKPKALAKRNGKEFILYSFETLRSITKNIIIVVHPELKKDLPVIDQAIFITDIEPYKGKGPLAGLFSVMSQYEAKWYMVLPCDVPFINDHILKILQLYQDEKWDAILPRVNKRIQPLVALYHCRVKEEIKSRLERNELSMKHLLDNIQVKYIDLIDEQPFMNINTKEEYEKFVR
jgi:molybdenum cofactor guanylyltransferase